jgi:hypothetical protein
LHHACIKTRMMILWRFRMRFHYSTWVLGRTVPLTTPEITCGFRAPRLLHAQTGTSKDQCHRAGFAQLNLTPGMKAALIEASTENSKGTYSSPQGHNECSLPNYSKAWHHGGTVCGLSFMSSK